MGEDWQVRFAVLHDILVLTWGLNAFNWLVLNQAMNWLGIRPRTLVGLFGIFFAPLLHRDLQHLFGNSISFMALGWLLLLHGQANFWLVSVVVVLTSGLGVWLFGRGEYQLAPDQPAAIEIVHIGASGVIFGYLGFLLFGSLFDRNPLALLLSLTVGVFYWNLLPGILPKQFGISWEAHLFGFLGGILAAWFLPILEAGARH
ncbi:MAG: rhomboid family intramembrane serine protease [Pegethrix bostrychoides GSE-TBD4-15B]|jgi:membrane associated rhomboid family serine protease|uniref:Rhomboid family intramembrane serine protease n=1 Tax=Pegethrix bostrychoides GSE-TBD4-15B TaxID=2839662 RepID=A0A951PBR5_9CYAN|nr:rhomboid family intramembrane serine protease [Pegethrix bostrychoides GSE-TBD4-15B]